MACVEGFQGGRPTDISPLPPTLSKSNGSEMLQASLQGEDCPIEISQVYQMQKNKRGGVQKKHKAANTWKRAGGHTVGGKEEGAGLCPAQHLLWPWESLQQRKPLVLSRVTRRAKQPQGPPFRSWVYS